MIRRFHPATARPLWGERQLAIEVTVDTRLGLPSVLREIADAIEDNDDIDLGCGYLHSIVPTTVGEEDDDRRVSGYILTWTEI
jgi:hypothetical protein